MSDSSSDSFEGLAFDERTTTANFQERLVQAQHDDEEPFNHNSIRFMNFYMSDDTEELKKQLSKLQIQVQHMESRVEAMENKLSERREKRDKEAGLTNLTPEERAAHIKQEEERRLAIQRRKEAMLARKEAQELKKRKWYAEEEEEEMGIHVDDDTEETEMVEEKPDWDVIFEYMLLLSNSPAEDESELLGPQTELRKKALGHADVSIQTTYSSLHITDAKNTLEHNINDDSDTRHCEIFGYSLEQKFHVSFDITEPSLIVTNFEFDVDIELQLDIGDVLQKVKEECDIMAFFRLVVHYATLDSQRKETFRKLTEEYKGTSINVEMLSPTRLQFEGNADCGINLLFSWKMIPCNLDKEKPDANIENHVQPELTLEAIALPGVIEKDTDNALDQVNHSFQIMIERVGIFKAIAFIINKVLI